MNIKNILKLSTLAISATIVKANECDELITYIKANVPRGGIDICKVNNEGQIVELNVYDNCFSDEVIDKILSHKTFTNLNYYIDNLEECPEKNFPKALTALTNLNTLFLSAEVKNASNKTIYAPDNLKILELRDINISQENIEEIAKITGLEKLDSMYASYDANVDLKPISHLTELTVPLNTFPENGLSIFKNVKKLEVYGKNSVDVSEFIEEISNLSEIEDLYLHSIMGDTYNLEPLRKLSKLTSLKTNVNFRTSLRYADDSFIYLTNLKKLDLTGSVYTQNMIDGISKLTNLEELSLERGRYFEGIDFEPLKSLTKLTVLKMKTHTSKNSFVVEIPEFVYTLPNLKHLDLNAQAITYISEKIGNLKNLEYLDVYNNHITTIPESLKELTKLEYLELGENEIKQDIPQYLNSFKNLKYFNIAGNADISGRTLINPSLQECHYNYNSTPINVCMVKDMTCFSYHDRELTPCLDTVTTTEEPVTTKTTTSKSNTTKKPTTTTTTTTKKTTTKKTTTKKTTTKKTTTKKTTTKKTTTKKTTTKKTTTKKTTTKKTTTKKNTTKKTTTKKPTTTTKKITTKKTTTKNISTKKTTTKKTTRRTTTKKTNIFNMEKFLY